MTLKNIFAMGLALGTSTAVGCADPCDDDGLGQEKCAAMSSDTDSSITNTDSMTNTDTDTDTDTDSDATADTTDSGGGMWCADEDNDGFGNPDMCSDDMGPDTVDNNDDCDDTDEDTFPGAAPNDDATACMNDDDGDDWGDTEPPPGVTPGTDCDDENPNAFPGAGVNENDPTLCTLDQDGDGWGDGNPPPGIMPGADCWDVNPLLNPSNVVLATVADTFLDDEVRSIDTTNAQMMTMAPLDTVLIDFQVTSTTIFNDGTIYGNNNVDRTIYEIDYQLVCVGQVTVGTVTPLPNAHGIDELCGITFAGNTLYAIDNGNDELVQINTGTGLATQGVALTFDGNPLQVTGCGMAWDCVQDRLLLANGLDGNVYEINRNSGVATLLADTDLTSDPTGLEHDPQTDTVWLASDTDLSRVQLDGTNTVEAIGAFQEPGGGPASVNNAAYLPSCDP